MIRLLVLALVSTLLAASVGASPAAAADDPELQEPALGIISADDLVAAQGADASEPPKVAAGASVLQPPRLFKKLRVQIAKRNAEANGSTLGRNSSLGNRQFFSVSCRIYISSEFRACYDHYTTGVFTGYAGWPADLYVYWERLYYYGAPAGWLASMWFKEWGRGWEPLQCKYYKYYNNDNGSATLAHNRVCY